MSEKTLNRPARSARLGSNIAESDVKDVKDDVADTVSVAPEVGKSVKNVKFLDEIKILLIPQAHLRIVCHYMDIDDVVKVKNAVSVQPGMIGLLMQSSVLDYMKSINYSFDGEFLLTQQGAIVGAAQHSWTLNGDVKSFTCDGLMFFKAPKKEDNIVLQVATDLGNGKALVTCYASTETRAKQLLDNLSNYAKRHNCLRGGKLRDVNVSAGTFNEVKDIENHTWENYFYSDIVKEMLDLEVFGFLADIEKYNAYGIRKRGVLLHGRPGGGKTTLGKIICHYAKNHSVLWVTPDMIIENDAHKMSIKMLYELADFIGPAVILLEDLDLFTEDRDAQQGNMVLGALMNILDGVNSVTNVVTIATTNRLELIEKALSNRPGRFDVVSKIDTMLDKQRLRMFTARLSNCTVVDGSIQRLVDKTDGWTAAECNAFVESMNLYFIRNNDEKRAVTNQLVDQILEFRNNFSYEKKKKNGAGFDTN